MIKGSNPHFLNTKLREGEQDLYQKYLKKMKIKSNSTELINNEGVDNNYNDKDTNIESGIEDNNYYSSIENKNVENNNIINISLHDGLNTINNTNVNNKKIRKILINQI